MWKTALCAMLRPMMRRGSLTVRFPDGQSETFGDNTGAAIAVAINDVHTLRRLALNPELELGEAYMDGRLTIEHDDIQGLLALALDNMHTNGRVWWVSARHRLRWLLRRMLQYNAGIVSRQNVAHHYDLSARLYELFLDADRQYSCAYFRSPDDTLDAAQEAKKHHIAAKLRLEPGMRVLDIGCGWGGMGLTLARDYRVKVLGITLSQEQCAVAQARARENGLQDQVEFRLIDYRDVAGQFDRIVSVGMFEHVGLAHFDAYFKAVHNLLTPDGVALIHTIGTVGRPGATNPWITKYIFPGGYIPSLSEMSASTERAGLWVADIEVLRLHYAMTLRHWFDRVTANQTEIRDLYDDRFLRMWKFYLASSEQTFRQRKQAVFQFQISRKIDAVPITREYLYDEPPLGRRSPQASNAPGAPGRKRAPKTSAP